ncbi:zinc finger protein 544-like isoform X2 [Syngnathus acus]|uniref:zinc finger protein 544-like isoform X2 n=1 Tax=Syngnathus acus TaxID=161584 RepID=UPI001885E411|nr:zinc finger protein 544-like isoform X2 [Syngnathus acus]
MSARTSAKYVKEKDRSRRQLEHLWLQPYVVLRRADISEAICPKQPERTCIKEEDVGKEVHHFNEQMEQKFLCTIKEEKEPERPCSKEEGEESCNIKEEEEEPERTCIKEEDVGKEVHHFNEQMEQKFLCTIKEEEEPERPCSKEEGEEFCDIKEEEDTCKMPLTGVAVKSFDEGQQEVSKGAEPPSCSSSQTMTREGDGDHCGGSQAAPPSDSDDVSSHVPAAAESQNKHRQCSQCGKCCANNSVLKQHMKMHTGEKPFSCSVCGQTFSQRGHLKTHTRVHTGEKPFSCSVCGQNFRQRVSLIKHTVAHT